LSFSQFSLGGNPNVSFSTLRNPITDKSCLLRDPGITAKQKPMSGATTVSVFGLTAVLKVSMISAGLATAMVL